MASALGVNCRLLCVIVAQSLLELPKATGADGETPVTCNVERDFQHTGLAP